MTGLLLDETGDVMINGGLVAGDTTAQNQKLLILLPKGAVKEAPDATVSAINYLESEDPSGLLRETRIKFVEDGMQVKKVGFNDKGMLLTDASYPE